MVWQASTSSGLITANATMGTGTALNRAWVNIPSAVTITGFLADILITPAAGAGTYNNYATGTFMNPPDVIVGISYVPTGGAIPSLATTFDDPQYLWVGQFAPMFDRNTINTAGTPAYKDLFIYGMSQRGRVQLGSGGGGSIYFHLMNTALTTGAYEWYATTRVSFHP